MIEEKHLKLPSIETNPKSKSCLNIAFSIFLLKSACHYCLISVSVPIEVSMLRFRIKFEWPDGRNKGEVVIISFEGNLLKGKILWQFLLIDGIEERVFYK